MLCMVPFYVFNTDIFIDLKSDFFGEVFIFQYFMIYHSEMFESGMKLQNLS